MNAAKNRTGLERDPLGDAGLLFGPTFGSPDGYTTPMFTVGVRPAVRQSLRFFSGAST